MSRPESPRARLPKGVTELPRPRGGRAFRASVRSGKGVEVHLGLYETPWLAACACRLAARLLRKDYPPLDVPTAEQPTARQVRDLTDKVRRRLGLKPDGGDPRDEAPDTEDLLTLFEVTVVEFWKAQAGSEGEGHPGSALDAAAGRLVDAAHLLFWSRSAGHPEPLEAMTRLLSRRLEQAFRRSDLTRAVLDDDGDEERRVALWLVRPDAPASGRCRGFREEVRFLYPECFEGQAAPAWDSGATPAWAVLLGLRTPFNAEAVRAAFRARSRVAHPDAGGSDAEFVRLREAYEAALAHCSDFGL